jgi:hypothetical protein
VRMRCGNTCELARLVGESKQGKPRSFVVSEKEIETSGKGIREKLT